MRRPECCTSTPQVESRQGIARLSPTSPADPDGKYGKNTAASVLPFQRSRRPQVREGDDGELIGPWTRSELDVAEVERLLE